MDNLFLIVVLGPDGSGKSSLIKKLMFEYKSSALNYYSHFYPSLNEKIKDNFIYPYSKKPYSFIISNLKVIYIFIKIFFNFLLILLKSRKGKTIIWCDRYLYDIFADPLRYRLKNIIFKPEFIKKFSIKPNIIFILNPPIEVILKRSSELSYKELKNQRKSYDKLINYFPNSVLFKKNYSIEKLSEICKFHINSFIKD